MKGLKNLPIGMQDFKNIRMNGYVYVDKTGLIYDLTHRGRYYFLSRPRRFGKSLLVSTIKEYFDGNKSLFEGLAIEELEKDWTRHPVLHIDLNSGMYTKKGGLEDKLNILLDEWGEKYGSRLGRSSSFGDRFAETIRNATEKNGRQAVILIDEYEKPLLDTINNKSLNSENRETLRNLYSALKSMDGYIRFALITGVTKLGKLNIFSDINNLNDISSDRRFAAICGITEREMRDVLNEGIKGMAVAYDCSEDEMLMKLRKNYDGYRFAPDAEGVFNPFSLLSAMEKEEIRSYWFSTGTPYFLTQIIKDNEVNLENMVNCTLSESEFDKSSTISNLPAMLYQTGYLTIGGYNREYRTYTLKIPNEEVKKGLMENLIPMFGDKEKSAGIIENLVESLKKGDAEKWVKTLQSYLKGYPYDLIQNTENYYQNVVYILCSLIGMHVDAEQRVSDGRIDMVMESDSYRFVIEFKKDKNAKEAVRQIEDKEYSLKFANDRKRKTINIGINFSTEKRNITDYWIEESLFKTVAVKKRICHRKKGLSI